MRYTVLIAEDDADIVDMLMLYMNQQEFRVLHAPDGRQALQLLKENHADILIVDIMMPGMNGFELIREIRKTGNMPVIVLSARGADNDRVLGLNIGADAYLTKPFNPFEVIAYLKALLRRYYQLGGEVQAEKESDILTVRDLQLDLKSFTLRRRGVTVPVTSSEFKILSRMMRNPGRVYTKAQLYQCINQDSFISDDNTVMVHISNIRGKIEDDPSSPEYIITVRGLGYKFENYES